MPTLLEKIEKSEAAVTKLKGIWKKTRKEFLKDGVIDAKEEEQLQKIRDKIDLADQKVFDLREEFETNKAEWDGKSDSYEEFRLQVVELDEWGDPVAAELKKDAIALEDFDTGQQWKKASERLDAAMKRAKKPAEERARQLLFKVDYERLDASAQKIYSEQQTSDFASAKDVAELIVGLDGVILKAHEFAQSKAYDKACETHDDIFDKLNTVAEAIAQHEIEYETFALNRDVMAERLIKIEDNDYQSEITAGAVRNINANLPAIDEAAKGFNYSYANELLMITFDILSEAETDIAQNDPDMQPTHKIVTPDGKTLMFTKAEYEAEVAKICREIEKGPLNSMKSAVEILRDKWQHFYDMNDDQYIVSFIVETIARADLPSKSIVTKAEDAYKKCQSAAAANKLADFTKSCGAAEKSITDGMQKMHVYQNEIEGAADFSITVLEFTATASFTFCSVFAAPVVASVAGTGALASAVIGGAAVAATQSTATEIGHWGAGGFNVSLEGGKDSVTNIFIDTGVGAVTGLITKGGGGGKHVVEAIVVKAVPKVAAESGMKILSKETVKKVTVYLVTEGAKQSTEDAVKNVGAMLKGDPKMTREKFFEDIAVSFVKGVALAPLGAAIDKYAAGTFDKLAPSDRAKIEDVVSKGVSKRLTDDIHIDAFNNEIKDKTDEIVKKYFGDMFKKNAEKVIEKTVAEMDGPYSPKAVEQKIRDNLLTSPEHDEAVEKAIDELVKEAKSVQAE